MADFTITLQETGGSFNAEFGEYIGGGSSVTPLTVTENGTYDAGTNAAYNPVTVNVADGAVAIIEGTATSLPIELTKVNDYGCCYLEGLTEVLLPNVTELRGYAFANCENLTRAEFPALTSAASLGRQFGACPSLEHVDLGSLNALRQNMFLNDTALESVVLRKDGVATFIANAFNGTSFTSGGVFIYVPDDLVDTYKAATGWSTYASQIKGISELPTT